MAEQLDKSIAELEEKIISLAYSRILRTKGKEYSPTAIELEKEINRTAVEFGNLFWNHKNPHCQININKLTQNKTKMETTQKETISKTETVDANEPTQTAIEWLAMIYHQREGFLKQEDIAEAKHLEMMQIVKAYHRGLFGGMELDKPIVFADEYYKETYNK